MSKEKNTIDNQKKIIEKLEEELKEIKKDKRLWYKENPYYYILKFFYVMWNKWTFAVDRFNNSIKLIWWHIITKNIESYSYRSPSGKTIEIYKNEHSSENDECIIKEFLSWF